MWGMLSKHPNKEEENMVCVFIRAIRILGPVSSYHLIIIISFVFELVIKLVYLNIDTL